MTNKTFHKMQKNAISYFEYVEYAGMRQKNMFMQKKCNIVTRRSKTPRLLTSNMNVNVHICNIYSAYIYICVCIMPFLKVTILFNQYFIIVENIVGKVRTGNLTSS